MEEDTAARVQEILNNATEEIKSVKVDKEQELDIDVGNLLVSDPNTVNEKLIRDPEQCEKYLYNIARDGVQALFSKVWELTPQHIDNYIYVTLPKPTTRLPREKPLPKGPVLTKWEQYAREKGLTRRKKEKKNWDETLKRWVPRYGYRKVQAEKEKNWVLEVPANADPFEDQFEKKSSLKKERVAKNEYQRLRNIARHNKIVVPQVGVTGNSYASPKELVNAMHHAKHATASAGKFQETLEGEKKAKGTGKKRKSEYVTGDGEKEKKRCLEILNKINKADLNLEGAIDQQIRDENVEEAEKKKGGKKFLRRSKMGGRAMNKSDHKSEKQGKGFSKIAKEKKMKPKTKKALKKAKNQAGFKKSQGKNQTGFKKSQGAGYVGNKSGQKQRGKGGRK